MSVDFLRTYGGAMRGSAKKSRSNMTGDNKFLDIIARRANNNTMNNNFKHNVIISSIICTLVDSTRIITNNKNTTRIILTINRTIGTLCNCYFCHAEMTWNTAFRISLE